MKQTILEKIKKQMDRIRDILVEAKESVAMQPVEEELKEDKS